MNTEDDNKPASSPAPVRPGTDAGSAEPKPESWDDFFALYTTTDVPDDYMSEADRNQGTYNQTLRLEIEQAFKEGDAEELAEWAKKRAAHKFRIDEQK